MVKKYEVFCSTENNVKWNSLFVEAYSIHEARSIALEHWNGIKIESIRFIDYK